MGEWIVAFASPDHSGRSVPPNSSGNPRALRHYLRFLSSCAIGCHGASQSSAAPVFSRRLLPGDVNWRVFLQFLYQVPYGTSDPLFNNDISFYLFTLPAYVAIKNWMLLTLFLSALFAGAIYWVHGDIEYAVQRRSISPTAIAHGSVLLGLFFAVRPGPMVSTAICCSTATMG